MNSVHISEKKRDMLREKLFKDCYGIDSIIHVINYNDTNWDWDLCVLIFRDTLGKNYGLVEHFKDGLDNSTKFVYFEYEDKSGKFCQEKFEKFIDAEEAMVELIKKRLKGEDL